MNQSEQQVIDESILLEDESLLLSEMNRYVQDENGTCRSVSDGAASWGCRQGPTGRCWACASHSTFITKQKLRDFLKEYFFVLFTIFRRLDVSDGWRYGALVWSVVCLNYMAAFFQTVCLCHRLWTNSLSSLFSFPNTQRRFILSVISLILTQMFFR